MDDSPTGLVKASLTRMETLETVKVLWNPSRYQVRRRNFLRSPRLVAHSAPDSLHLARSEESFETELFLDTTDRPVGATRDARGLVDKIASWMSPDPPDWRAPRVIFLWGPFRFPGAIEALDQEWVRFDPDGTPVRAWVGITLRRM